MIDSRQKPQNNRPFDLVSTIASMVAEAIGKQLNDKNVRAEMLSARTIARIIDCSESEVRKALQQGRIKTVKFGRRGYRVPREEFEKHLTRWKNGGELWD